MVSVRLNQVGPRQDIRLHSLTRHCAGLADREVENTNLLPAKDVPAIADLPTGCQVLGYVRPASNFEMRHT